jgi:isopentenyl diphosphate isomerase/L-lactate dehydrogenase-like FMN-dependent dehydrogenase
MCTTKPKRLQKRYQHWARENGKPVIKWTEWFDCSSNSKEKIQLKGFKGNDLLNEIREV